MMDFFIAKNHNTSVEAPEPVMQMLTLPFSKQDAEYKNGIETVMQELPKIAPKEPTPEPEIFTGFNYLPMELLLKVMKQISVDDRLACGQTCHRWMEAAHYYLPFSDRIMYRFTNINFTDYEPPIKNFLDAFRIFPRIAIKACTFYGNSQFWPLFGAHVIELTLKNCLIRDTELLYILENVPNLRQLKIEQCDELFRSWYFEKRSTCCESHFVLPDLIDVSLTNNDFLDELHFNKLMTLAPNIAHLDLSNCFKMIASHRRVAMVEHIMRFINMHQFQLHTLKFNGTLAIDDICLSTLSLIDGLNLETFSMTFCDKIPAAIIDLLRRQPDLNITQDLEWKVGRHPIKAPGFISFLVRQTNLVHLDLTSSLGITDEVMELITTCLPKLKTLKLRRCILVTDEGIMNIVNLVNLEVLDLSNCYRISDHAMYRGVIGRKVKNLHELYLCELPTLSDYSLIQVTLNYEMLQVLDLSNSPNAATDATMQYINYYLVSLKQLHLYCCTKLTDSGLTGIDLPVKPMITWDQEETFPLDRLFKLRVLNLIGCYRITDLSLENAFKLAELKELHLARCYQISEKGISVLSESAKALEFIDLSECPLVNDNCIEMLTLNLKRLRTLKVNKCPQLTNACLEIIGRNCSYLKYLHIIDCRRLKKPRERLANHRSLKAVYMEMSIESWFNLHYYGFGHGEDGGGYDEDEEEESEEDERTVPEPIEEVDDREFPFHDDVFYINLKGPRVRTGFDKLPMEIMLNIFRFLNAVDRDSAALTCKRWFDAMGYREFLDEVCFHFEEVSICDGTPPIALFLRSFRHFSNIKLTRVQFNGYSEFWDLFGEYIREITFCNCPTLTKSKLTMILKRLPYVECLALEEADEFFKTWTPVEFKRIEPVCRCLRKLALRKSNAFTVDHLYYLIAMGPNINALEISKCLKQLDAPTRVKILTTILAIMKMRKKKLQAVDFSYTMYDDLFLKQFAEIENMSLSQISLSFFERAPIKDPGIIDILRCQSAIVHLDLSSFLNLTDFALIEISTSLRLLKTLKLNGCWLLTDFGVESIYKLDRLQVLDLSDCDKISDRGFMKAIVDRRRDCMSQLYLSMLPGLTDSVILKICLTLLNLTVIDFCGSDCMNDTSVQFLFCYLKCLRILRLNGCVKISDAGLTGENLPVAVIEIWDTQTTFSISELRSLQELQLSGCFKVTDFTLAHSFRFRELRELNLAHCVQISEPGIEAMSLNCPALEQIDMSDCFHVNDRCVEALAKNLVRLRSLKLVRLPLLTVASVDALVLYAKVLRYINIRGCNKIPKDAPERLKKIATLRNIPKKPPAKGKSEQALSRSKSLDQPSMASVEELEAETSDPAKQGESSRKSSSSSGSKASSSSSGSSSRKKGDPQKVVVQEKRQRNSIFTLFPDVQWKPTPEENISVPVQYCDWMEPFSCDGNFTARYDLLPMELILKIFKQLNSSDRLAASEACRRWFEAAHYYEPFQRQMFFNFDRIEFNDEEGPIKYFSQPMRTYPYLTFTFVEFTKHSDFWLNNGAYIRELTLRCCLIRKKKFITIMKNLPMLERLELMQCDELFKHWTLDYSTDEPMFPFTLPHLKHLSLAACDYYNEYHFERFIEVAPALESIDVSNCFINLYLSRRMTMISRVMRLVSKNRNFMKALNISDIPCFDDVAWHLLAEMSGLFLTHFTVTYTDRIPLKDPGILKFFSVQTRLTHLDLTSSIGVNDVCLQLIVESCPLLEVLKLRRCWLLSDEGVQDLHTLKHLRVLDVSSCERISDYGMRVGIIGKRARRMDEAYFSLLCTLSDYTMYYLVLMFKNLQVLDLDSNATITDTSLQYLCCYSQDLRNLNLQSCAKLVVQIFKYLSTSDRRSASFVCSRWYEASKYCRFAEQMVLHLIGVDFDDFKPPVMNLILANRKYPLVKLSRVKLNVHSKFWQNYGPFVHEITFEKCMIWRERVISLFKYMPNLRVARFVECDLLRDDLFRTWKFFDNGLYTIDFPGVETLSLAKNNFSQLQFESMVEMMPNLTRIDFSNCFRQVETSRKMFLLSCIQKFIVRRQYVLRSVNISGIPVDDIFLRGLADAQGLLLEELSLTYLEKMPAREPAIVDLFRRQTNLRYLDVSSSTGITDYCVDQIVRHIGGLRILVMTGCWGISDYGIKQVFRLQQLVSLNLSNCIRMSKHGIIDGAAFSNRAIVKELHLELLDTLDEECVVKIGANFPNLSVLNIGGSSTCMTDWSAQYIFCNLVNLEHLNIERSTKLTDAGFTGIDLPEKTFSIWDVEETFAIDRLKKLRVLKVSGCYRMTDFALRYGFRFTELKELSLSRCHQISEAGVERLVSACPALEFLDLSECPNINDNCVKMIAVQLKRISTLKLANCPLLTENCIDCLVTYCKNLKYLYVRGCFKLPPDTADRLSKIPTLRQVYKS
uniref:F-box domain-containing protein n=1 Tax=Anopheles christyi TaxID=43041 RepID=A0A182JPX9_9DIPT